MTHSGSPGESPVRRRTKRQFPEGGPDASQRVIASAQPDRLLNVGEAASLLGLKVATLYTWASERRIPTVKIGRALRIRKSVIEDLIANCERPALDAVRVGGRAPGRRSGRL